MNSFNDFYGTFVGGWRGRFRPWREISILSLVFMELSWVVPWYRSLTRELYAVSTFKAFYVLGGILVLSMMVFRTMNLFRLRVRVRQAVLLFFLFGSVFLGIKTLLYAHESVGFWEAVVQPVEAIISLHDLIPDEFLVAVIILITWWRGISLARTRVSPEDVLEKFQFGFLMLVGFVFINTFSTGQDFGSLLYVYLFGGLLAMGAARVSVLEHLRGGRRNPFNSRWFFGLVFTTGFLVIFTAAVLMIMRGEIGVFSQIVIFLWTGFIILILVISLPAIIALLWLIEQYINRAGNPAQFLIDLVNTLDQLRENLLVMAEQIYVLMENLGIFRFLDFLPRLKPVFFVVILAGVIFVLLIIIGLGLRIAKRGLLSEDESESIISSEKLLEIIGGIIKKQINQIRKSLTSFGDLSQRRKLLAAAKIRRIYSQLMELTEEMGYPRLEAQTPLEFLASLESVFPLYADQIEVITDAYLKVRYGELPETEDEIAAVEAAWKLVQEEGHSKGNNNKMGMG